MKLNNSNYFKCYPGVFKQALPPVPSDSEGRGGWLNTAWAVWNRQCRTRLRRSKPQPNSPFGPALWRCPWKMPAGPALWRCPWTMPADAALWTRSSMTSVRVRSSVTPFEVTRRSGQLLRVLAVSSPRQRGPDRPMSCAFQVIFFYNFIFKFNDIKEREWLLAGAQCLLIYNIFNKIYI